MSDALAEVDPDLLATLDEERARKPAKPRNIKRRQVVNLPDEMAYWLAAHSREISGGIVPSAIRFLLAEAIRARGVTPAMMKAEYHEAKAKEAREGETDG